MPHHVYTTTPQLRPVAVISSLMEYTFSIKISCLITIPVL